MKFATRQDSDLSADDLFTAIGDFPRAERMLVNRGAQVRRLDPSREPGAGMAWDIGFDLRGKRRELRLAVIRFDRPESIFMEGRSDLFELTIEMTVIALTRVKSRLIFELEVKPRNMRARLLLQTAKLGKSKLDRQFAERIADFVRVAGAHRTPPPGAVRAAAR
ncbi:hypothetical protein KTN05_02975 [Paracoccus sp. Z118]|uniref:hypothetical protein n=1 Tax=Paracoccus sp. Z118 TaxID=2851017 RepID=UPI001C2C9F90|nr:hypothetical protein [Paracoccus sp. Z118]MBV0890809.1 hypothetical protein [Paracoccus sp. Z118]